MRIDAYRSVLKNKKTTKNADGTAKADASPAQTSKLKATPPKVENAQPGTQNKSKFTSSEEDPINQASTQLKGKQFSLDPDQHPNQQNSSSRSRKETSSFDSKNPDSSRQEGFLKTGPDKSGKHRKIAKLLILLGQDSASEIVKHLTPDELEVITMEMSRIDRVEEVEAVKLLSEFGQKTPVSRSGLGGPDMAREMLCTAFGKEEGEELFKKACPFEGRRPFDFLNDLDADQLTIILRKESENVLAIVLPHLKGQKASRVLESLTPDIQHKVVRRIAKMKKIHPDALLTTEEYLRESIRKHGTTVTQELDGVSVLADILEHIDPRQEQDILSQLQEDVPEIGTALSRKLFSLSSVAEMPTRDLEKVLREFSDEELAFILKGKNTELVDRFLGGVSERRKMIISEEMERIGVVRKSDVETATEDFLQYIQYLSQKGDIHFPARDDMYI